MNWEDELPLLEFYYLAMDTVRVAFNQSNILILELYRDWDQGVWHILNAYLHEAKGLIFLRRRLTSSYDFLFSEMMHRPGHLYSLRFSDVNFHDAIRILPIFKINHDF